MKNRKLFIVSFLVVATLIVGVGFAAVGGVLTVDGSIEYNGQLAAQDEIKDAMKFTGVADMVNCEATVSGHAATLNVVFNDTDGNINEEAHVTYTISYNSTEELPDVYFRSASALNAANDLLYTTVSSESLQYGDFDISVQWLNEDGSAIADGEQPSMENGDTLKLHVVVTYSADIEAIAEAEEKTPEEIRAAITNAEINASIHGDFLYSTDQSMTVSE